jgi:hypothetical protein
LHYYFSSHFQIPPFSSYQELLATKGAMQEVWRAEAQLIAMAPVYVAIAYSAMAWIAMRLGIFARSADGDGAKADPSLS